MDSTLSSLGFPRKTIGINVTQIGLDEVRVANDIVLGPKQRFTMSQGASEFLQTLDDHPQCAPS